MNPNRNSLGFSVQAKSHYRKSSEYNMHVLPLSWNLAGDLTCRPHSLPCSALSCVGSRDPTADPLMEVWSLSHFKAEEMEAQKAITGLMQDLSAGKWLRAKFV